MHRPAAHIAAQGSSPRTSEDNPAAATQRQPKSNPSTPPATASAIIVVRRLGLQVRQAGALAPPGWTPLSSISSSCISISFPAKIRINPRALPSLLSRPEDAVAHHAAVLVLEIVAVVHEQPGFGGRDEHPDPFSGKKRKRILETGIDESFTQIFGRIAAAALQYAEAHAVDMHGMRHGHHASPFVGKGPHRAVVDRQPLR